MALFGLATDPCSHCQLGCFGNLPAITNLFARVIRTTFLISGNSTRNGRPSRIPHSQVWDRIEGVTGDWVQP